MPPRTRATTSSFFSNFFSSKLYAVVGASNDPTKYGNKVLKWYIANQRPTIPVNPNETTVEDLQCVPNLSSIIPLDAKNTSVSVITPGKITKQILEEAAKLGIRRVWLQPGAEFPDCGEFAERVGIDLIYGGPCVLVDGPKFIVNSVI
ncbi:3337_t:CDS:2 [Ambispora leptoticha]|uniref:3337_t:CDS:1 n=1 Tax=Ambispora leptoticha TaxID=144679 RepID=A0A9N9ASH2_9GLOM|nr:3337_t:CDS:2 [Ambispora leptoticha]